MNKIKVLFINVLDAITMAPPRCAHCNGPLNTHGDAVWSNPEYAKLTDKPKRQRKYAHLACAERTGEVQRNQGRQAWLA